MRMVSSKQRALIDSIGANQRFYFRDHHYQPKQDPVRLNFHLTHKKFFIYVALDWHIFGRGHLSSGNGEEKNLLYATP